MRRLVPLGIALLAACGSGSLPFGSTGKDEALLTLDSGAVIEATTDRAISSRTDQAGGTLTASVSKPVKDGEGLVVIPAGSTLHLTIAELQPANDKSAADGRISLVLSAVTVGGKQFPVAGEVTSMVAVAAGTPITVTLRGPVTVSFR